MWRLITTFLKWLLLKVLGKRIAALLALFPIAFLLKFIGLPLLIILLVVGLPVFFILALFGLPIILVLVVGAGIVMAIFAVLSFGLVLLKFLLPFLIIAWLLRWLWSMIRGKRGDDPDSAGRPAPRPPPPPPASSSGAEESTSSSSSGSSGSFDAGI